MINVTKTYLPPFEEYTSILKRAWDKEWLTNRGELVIELEKRISDYLNLHESKLICMNNGTIPIQIALKLLAKGGEVITTPFSYVATAAAIMWENCTPIFVDIHPEYLTIDENKIEEAITKNTTCILATHVFGNPCNIEAIDSIAKKHNLKVIYDAAHCFGVTYNGKSIFEYGDVSTCSFHATKLFHTGEGGALFTRDSELLHKCYYSHNFGHDGPLSFHGLGINGQISELQAAMGLSILPYLTSIMEARAEILASYDMLLDFTFIQKIKLREKSKWNYSYYPIIFKDEDTLLEVQKNLNAANIFPRRYFFPSLNTIEFLMGQKMTFSESISSRIICLPLYKDLSIIEVEKICSIINISNHVI